MQCVPLSRLVRELGHEHDHQIAQFYNRYHPSSSWSPFSPAFDDLFFSRRGGSNVLNKFFRAMDSELDNQRREQSRRDGRRQGGQLRDNTNNAASTSNTNTNSTTNAANTNVSPSSSSAPAKRGSSSGSSVDRYEVNNPFAPYPYSSFWSPFLSAFPSAAYQPILPSITLNVYSTPTEYQIQAELPGVKKEEIVISIEKGTLTIEAERKEERNLRPKKESSATSTATTATEAKTNTTQTADDSSSSSSASSTQTADKSEASSSSVTSAGSTAAPASSAADANDEVEELHVESHYGKVSRSISLPDDAEFDSMTAKYEDGVIKIEIPRKQLPRDERKVVQLQ